MSRKTLSSTGVPIFRHVHEIEKLNDTQLSEHMYYRGYPCVHGHVIRDVNDHWCYHCAQKILSNMCGFDVNYLHTSYKVKYEALWRQLRNRDLSDCWDNHKITKRLCFPSYRSFYRSQKSENVTVHKLIYQCAWGDVGAFSVTRLCGNKNCLNPLHLISSWNQNIPTKVIEPFVVYFDYAKLMLAAKRESEYKPLDDLVRPRFKMSIPSPYLVKNPEE